MPTTLAALGRIVVQYQTGGVNHRHVAYVRNPQTGGSTYKINTRASDANDLDWEDASDGLTNIIANAIATGAVFGSSLLQERSGTIWNTVSTHTISDTPSGGSYIAGSQIVVSLRDTAFRRVKVVLEDSAEAAPQRSISPTGGDSHMDNLISGYLSTHSNPNDPFAWIVGRANAYLNLGPFISFSVDINRKVKRAHGY